MADTAIEWTDATWNPTTGCDQVSPGCDNCYALTLAKRLKGMGSAKYQTDGDPRTSGPGFGLAMHPEALTLPLGWRKPRRVFVNSMSDLFHARITRDFAAKVFATMAVTPQHTYQILTKRPERMQRVLSEYRWWTGVVCEALEIGRPGPTQTQPDGRCALLNVWLGTSIESDKYVRRADDLRATPAAVRFLSLEPLLGPLPSLDLTGIDWVITGGESGPSYRPAQADWFRSIRDQCEQAGVAYLHKQNGGRTPKAGGRMLDGITHDGYPEVA